MKALILQAGYGTRMYPLTENFPKGLLPVGGRPLIDYLVMNIESVPDIDTIYVVTNQKFYPAFAEWHKNFDSPGNIVLINDGTLTNETRLGSIRDMQLTIETNDIRDDLLVVGGDNIFDMSFVGFVEYFKQKKGDIVAVQRISDKERRRRTGVVLMDDDSRLTACYEKPDDPVSELATPPLYMLRRETLPLIAEYIREGNDTDAPGNLTVWLYKRRPVYGYLFKGECYDIGDMESYERLRDGFSQ
ncbi:MAG: nucleotidyltransferase family protein [Planctomycetes bacterium]|nr:nucleotidyltransferase family protein [Planctomycetota bacterium]